MQDATTTFSRAAQALSRSDLGLPRPAPDTCSNGIPCWREDTLQLAWIGLLESLSRCPTRNPYSRVVELRVATRVQKRIDELAERANGGTLSDGERLEYEAFVNAASATA